MPQTHSSPNLRRLRSADAPDVLTAFKSNPDMGRKGDVENLTDAELYVARLMDPDGPHEAWAVTETDQLVGLVAVTVDEANKSGWFWYWMGQEARGRGWVGRAAATVADWAFEVRGLERLELGHRVNNPASGVVVRKAGFVQEGIERAKFLVDGERIDVVTYGRLSSDPVPEYESIEIG